MLTQTELDIAPREGPTAVYRFLPVDQLLKMFDKSVAEARPLIQKISDADLQVPWTLKAAGREVNTSPRYMA